MHSFHSLLIKTALTFTPGATANFTGVTVTGLSASTGTFVTVEAENYADMIGNDWLTIANGGTPTLVNDIILNNRNLTGAGSITSTSIGATTVNTNVVIAATKIESPAYSDVLGNNFLTIGAGGQPTLTNTLA